ncbi:MAG: hypothetical protein KC449_12545 [Anaerolineales bacterium]|nr:hypothetical protein [Anaerolineales bacterium]
MNKRLFLLLGLILLVGLLVRRARADTLTVCALGCDFSSVDTAVSAAASGDTLQLAGETFNENLVILKSLTLQGVAGTVIDGSGIGRVISVTTGVNVSLFNLTVQNGSAEDGGGIFNRGNLTLENVVVQGNTAVPNETFGEGGGIFNLGTLTASSSTISQNSAEYGGGLENNGGTVFLTDVVISGNTATDIFDGVGGGLENSSGSATLTRVTVQNNTANFVGGGIQNLGQMTITDSLISGNVADLGGGLASGSSTGLTLQNSTIAGNSSSANGIVRGGAGVYNTFVMGISNSTISGNETAVANGDGGGIFNNNLLTVASSTIFGNSASDQGGGLRNASGITTVANTILAQNGEDCSGSGIQSSGYNLASDASCSFTAVGDQTGIDPQLGPLQDNGGATPTQALTENSPAFNAGNPAAVGSSPACPTTDQRGISRPQGGRCDIGAFEMVVEAEPPSDDETHLFVPFVQR